MAATMRSLSLILSCRMVLSTETELLDNVSVSLDVGPLEVVQELTSLTYEAKEGTACDNVLLVLLHVLREVIDTVGK